MNCPHFAELVFHQAQKYGNKTALWYQNKETKSWTPISWNQFASSVKTTAKAIYDIGISNQQKIAIYSPNKPESFIVDFASFTLNAVVVPLYATSTVQQIEYIINDASISILFVGEQFQYDNAYEVMKTSRHLKHIVIFDNAVVTHGEETSIYFTDFLKAGEKSTTDIQTQKTKPYSEEDPATLMYTSGTTGEPKGVILSHGNYLEAMRIHDIRLTTVTDQDTSIAFLPINHVLERAWCYFCLFKGVEIYINLHPQDIQQAIRQVHPTLMCAVPRFWEKVYIGVQEKLEEFSPFMKGIVAWAIATGKKHNIDHIRLQKKPSPWLSLCYFVADKIVFSKLKKTLGFERANFLPTAGASLSDEITIFLRSIGIPIIYGYGLTETTATVCCFEYYGYEVGTAGSIMPDIQVKIGEDNEILVKGKTVFHGYYNRPEINKTAFTEDGFFKTGDAGKVINNQIILTERLKDLFKTSNGKYIAPQQIETRLTTDKYIDQVAIIGDQRNYVTAIVVPNLDFLKEYADNKKIAYQSTDDLLSNPQIVAFYQDRINNTQKDMASFEQIKKFTLIKKGFTLEAGEITNTLKLRRAVIQQRYKSIIDQMYNS
jgi:long-chain acyl-CoA synthetase